MACLVEMAGKAAQGASLTARGEPQTVTLDQESFDTRLEGHGGGAHDALPGQGKATAARLRLSSLA